MKSETLIPFSFNDSPITVVIHEGEPWFVANQVCEALGYKNTSDALATHLDSDERMTVTTRDGHLFGEIMTLAKRYSHSGKRGGAQFLTLINESGMYSLVLRSHKSEAKKFSKWVTREVLPSIRKTGSYSVNPDPVAELTENDLHNIKALCTHMRFAVGWWLRVEESIRGLNQNLASSVHDDFYHGAIFSSQLINKFNFDVASMDYIKNYPYNGSFPDRHNYDVQYRAVHGSTCCRANDIPPGFKKLRC